MTSRLGFETEIAFESLINETPAWRNVTPWVKEFDVKRGRSFELDNFETGTATVSFDNADDRFSPDPFIKVSSPENNLFPSDSPGAYDTIPGGPYFPISKLITYGNGVTVKVSGAGDVFTGCARVSIPTLLPTWSDIVAFPDAKVIEGQESQFQVRLCKADVSQPDLSIGLFVLYSNSKDVAIGYAHGTTPIKVSAISKDTAQPLIFKHVAPVGAVKVQYRLVARGATNVASSFLMTSAFAYNRPPFVGEPDWYFTEDQTTIRPNRRIRINSVIGNNIFPRWASSPETSGTWEKGFNGKGVQGMTAPIPPSDRWEYPKGPNGESWWELNFISGASEPSTGVGTKHIRFSYRKALADAVSGSSLKVGANSIHVYTAPIPFYNYTFSGWVKWAAGTGYKALPAGTTMSIVGWVTDQVNPSNVWSLGTIATITPGSSWTPFNFNGTMPWGMIAPTMKLTLSVLPNNDRSTISGDFGFDLIGLQCARSDNATGYRVVPFQYGDGAEPVFSGFIDRIQAQNNWTLGANDVKMECSDDLRIFSETIWNTPYQAVANKNQNVLAHFPLTDPAESFGTVGEAAGFVGSPGTLVNSTNGGRPITYGAFPFVHGIQGGTSLSFEWANGSFGTVIDITDPAIAALATTNKDRSKGRIDKGWSVDFWAIFPTNSIPRPDSGVTHFAAVALGRNVHIGVALTPSNDCLYALTGNEGITYMLMPLGYLTNSDSHFLSVSAGPADPTGKRIISLNVNDWAYRKTYVSTQPDSGYEAPASIGGRSWWADWQPDQFAGQLSCVTIYDTGSEDVTAKWQVGKNNTVHGGTTRTNFLASKVHPRYDMSNWKWGPGSSPTIFGPLDFSGVNALAHIQEITGDLQSVFFATREGRIGYLVKSTLDGLLQDAIAIPGNEMTLYTDKGEGPEPGYSLDYDLSHVYNIVTISRKNGISSTASSAKSVQSFGRRMYKRELKSIEDSWVRQFSREFMERWQNPVPRLSSLQWTLSTNDSLASKILSLELMGKLTIQENNPAFPGGIVYSRAYRVEGLSHQVKVNGAAVDWVTTMDVTAVGH
ncbi:hypothetical protein [Kitasatospora sp. MBT66]|uniref:hypothetical protein n=1 Tax=Kitasatospora sp. MBT66 TaxID=1444769 RepID=UPI000A4FAB4D|nr:hypothetical protein [Kitasatospora sp. MBT66]